MVGPGLHPLMGHHDASIEIHQAGQERVLCHTKGFFVCLFCIFTLQQERYRAVCKTSLGVLFQIHWKFCLGMEKDSRSLKSYLDHEFL